LKLSFSIFHLALAQATISATVLDLPRFCGHPR
jgi:hypothetical protein